MIYITLFILFTAISNIILNMFFYHIPNMLLIFLSTTYAVLFFNLIHYKTLPNIYKRLLNKKREYAFLLLSLLGIWVGSFLIPIHFLPSIYLFTFMAINGAIGSVALFYQNKKLSNLFRTLFMSINILIFYLICSRYYSGCKYIILILSTLITAVSGYAYLKISNIFNRYAFNSSQVLAIRFWLLWLLSLVATFYCDQFKEISLKIVLQTMGISFLYLITPIYCSQKSIETIGPEKTSLAIGFTPLVTFSLEKMFLNNSFNFTGYFSISLALILLFFYFYAKLSNN